MDGIILIVIFVVILVYVIYDICKKKFVEYHGPNSNVIRKQIHYDEKTGKCYSFKPVVHICPINLSMK